MSNNKRQNKANLDKSKDKKVRRSCPYGAKCDPALWGDPMCQKCETKGL